MSNEERRHIEKLRVSLLLVLDNVDYTAEHPGCRVTEMVGAVLPREIIEIARKTLKETACLVRK